MFRGFRFLILVTCCIFSFTVEGSTFVRQSQRLSDESFAENADAQESDHARLYELSRYEVRPSVPDAPQLPDIREEAGPLNREPAEINPGARGVPQNDRARVLGRSNAPSNHGIAPPPATYDRRADSRQDEHHYLLVNRALDTSQADMVDNEDPECLITGELESIPQELNETIPHPIASPGVGSRCESFFSERNPFPTEQNEECLRNNQMHCGTTGNFHRELNQSLIAAVYEHDNERVRQLIRDGADPDCSNEAGVPLLHVAYDLGFVDVASRLTEEPENHESVYLREIRLRTQMLADLLEWQESISTYAA